MRLGTPAIETKTVTNSGVNQSYPSRVYSMLKLKKVHSQGPKTFNLAFRVF